MGVLAEATAALAPAALRLDGGAGEFGAEQFLRACGLVLPVLGALGAGLAVVKADIGGNIDRLSKRREEDPGKYKALFDIVRVRARDLLCARYRARACMRPGAHACAPTRARARLIARTQAEMDARTASRTDSCTNALLWLRRAMAFVAALVGELASDASLECAPAAAAAYERTLKRHHGWLVQQGVTLALKLAPARARFEAATGGAGADEMAAFVAAAEPALEEVRVFLDTHGLDDVAV